MKITVDVGQTLGLMKIRWTHDYLLGKAMTHGKMTTFGLFHLVFTCHMGSVGQYFH